MDDYTMRDFWRRYTIAIQVLNADELEKWVADNA